MDNTSTYFPVGAERINAGQVFGAVPRGAPLCKCLLSTCRDGSEHSSGGNVTLSLPRVTGPRFDSTAWLS